ncbi:hypothetical protein BDV95DRAFT_655396 [Massariosphaeria phaeospora]|uniref:Uncharacterized protein n=1 Tax=Massariosphaeria phaeospora TaxID=100035 RepID=A0A7C8IGU1_9PLEO|nr:hypothetical protein BDV95DRAFT_655396 [Massariosphaeria phaeospora]
MADDPMDDVTMTDNSDDEGYDEGYAGDRDSPCAQTKARRLEKTSRARAMAPSPPAQSPIPMRGSRNPTESGEQRKSRCPICWRNNAVTDCVCVPGPSVQPPPRSQTPRHFQPFAAQGYVPAGFDGNRYNPGQPRGRGALAEPRARASTWAGQQGAQGRQLGSQQAPGAGNMGEDEEMGGVEVGNSAQVGTSSGRGTTGGVNVQGLGQDALDQLEDFCNSYAAMNVGRKSTRSTSENGASLCTPGPECRQRQNRPPSRRCTLHWPGAYPLSVAEDTEDEDDELQYTAEEGSELRLMVSKSVSHDRQQSDTLLRRLTRASARPALTAAFFVLALSADIVYFVGHTVHSDIAQARVSTPDASTSDEAPIIAWRNLEVGIEPPPHTSISLEQQLPLGTFKTSGTPKTSHRSTLWTRGLKRARTGCSGQ